MDEVVDMNVEGRFTGADLAALPDPPEGVRFEVIAGELLVAHQPHWDHQFAGLALGASQDRFGFFVHAEAAHLAGEGDLRFGIEPQAEEPLGRVAGALVIAQPHRQIESQRFALLHRALIERGDGVDDGQGVFELAHFEIQPGAFQAEVQIARGIVRGLGQRDYGGLAIFVPELHIGQSERGVEFFDF